MIKQWQEWFKSQHFARGSISTRYALIEACLIGIFSGLAALFLKEGINFLGSYRLQLVDKWGAIAVLPLFGLILGSMAGLLVENVSPEAAGGGIPQIKAALARYKIPLSLKVAVVKLIGTILVLGAGLTLGRRAPTVHIGAALAGELTRFVPTSPEHRRQMIAAGAAAGLAAGFNTPIAGVMFVVEELLRDVSNLTLETAIVASFTGAVVSLILQSPLSLSEGILSSENLYFIPQDIPSYLLLGVIAGVLGAIFNRSVLFSLEWNQKLKIPLFVRIGVAGLVSGLIISFLPSFFRDNAGLKDFLIKGELTWEETALAFLAHYILTIIAAGSGAPGGLFAPALIMGSALGYLVGDVEGYLSGSSAVATFSLVGMGALFTGVVRVPITAIIIVFELNGNFNLVLPLMISCAVAYISAETFEKGSVYQHLLRAMGMELQEENNDAQDHFLSHLTASDVMQSQVETISSDLTIPKVLELMTVSHHRGFPVVDDTDLVGIITQSDLVKVDSTNTRLKVDEIMTRNPITVMANASLTDVMYLLSRYQLSRLPVLQDSRLVGIITRTDIIRAEVNELKGDRGFKPQPAYTIYQTCSPAVGKGCMLVPVAKEDDFRGLFKIARAIATYYHYEIEFVRVIKIPKHQDPRTTKVDTREARHLMHNLERMGRKAKISVHTKIIVGHHRSKIVMDIIKTQHINLLLMGWKQNGESDEFIFSRLIDSLINQAPCELILVKLGDGQSYPNGGSGSFLVPTAGGPNAEEGLKLLPAFLSIYPENKFPPVYLTKVHSPEETNIDFRNLHLEVKKLRNLVKTEVNPLIISSPSVISAILHLSQSQNAELVILGASRESLLQQAWYGNIPESIASKLATTVIIIRLPS
ncbi:chloride channel protein [Geminocystis sp. NIES-3709]|uniref:chloride channel protein n=1 Tax=Geminocystis sp. NIES-3709 TaxID=1617448 RepID=UPI0005FC6FD7|nr:chloride channel protein [Geminocystis sp. NIES-3709]BAQ66775.1 tRNA nucleotidyltransferase [Geminocystis sp. NIES-3709]